ncbi:MAG: glycerol-3-phosphate 1-O-acyltransferase PlsY [Negativicutes bacterium]|nr:glycerol-3-phosphate 1-O-acyltransferase PlsY [Negativicutes bacterium]
MDKLSLLYFAVYAYLCGSIPSAYLIARVTQNIDIRKYGSGNVGATNALRTLGVKGALISLLFDILKTLLALALPFYLNAPQSAFYISGLAAICGHNWPVFLHFKGGKGVAVSTTLILLFFPRICILSLVILVVVVWLTRYVSLGSLVMSLLWPLMLFASSAAWPDLLFAGCLTVLIWLMHQGNIQRLLHHSEREIVFRKSEQT